ncbi:MAG: YdjY domain-containing protein [Verrucomicrobiota bacterium]
MKEKRSQFKVLAMTEILAAVFGVLAVLQAAPAAAENETNVLEVMRARNKVYVDNWFREAKGKHKQNSDMLALPGLLADRKNKVITVYAEATGLDDSGSPPEFFIISRRSGHDYEALLISFASPGDVHKALEFIGMKPGRPVNPENLEFWPKGERVVIDAVYTNSTDKIGPVKLCRLLVDAETEEPPPEKGFVFTGSMMVRTGTNGMAYAAEAFGPRSIASNYNEPYSVLDVPRVAPQGAVYRTFVVNSKYVFPAGGLVELKFMPEYPGGKQRVRDMSLHVENVPGKGASFRLVEGKREIVETQKADKLIKSLSEISRSGHDPFLEISFGDSMRLEDIRAICAGLSEIEIPEGIRVEPPPEGHLYYKAFLPDEKFLSREKRPAQPWELHIETAKEGGISATLIQIEQAWKKDQVWPDLVIKKHSVDSGKHLASRLNAMSGGGQLPVILVYADPGLRYGRLMGYILPVIEEFSTIHVFLNGKDGGEDKE